MLEPRGPTPGEVVGVFSAIEAATVFTASALGRARQAPGPPAPPPPRLEPLARIPQNQAAHRRARR